MELICKFDIFESKYRCIVKWIDFNDTNAITVFGRHKLGLTNENVEHIDIRYLLIEQFPSGLGRKFPNAVRLWINYAKIKKITREDFVGFTKLTTLTLIGNRISRLTEDAFSDLKSLTLLNLSQNYIQQIHPKAFDKLTKLDTLCLKSNMCIDKNWFDLSKDEQLRMFAMETIAYKCEKFDNSKIKGIGIRKPYQL